MHPSPWLKIGHPSSCPAQEASSSKHDQLRTALHLERSEDGVQIYDAFLLRWSSDKPLHFGISYWPRGASDVSDQLLLLPRNHFQASRCHHCHDNWKSLNIIENGTFNPKITELFVFSSKPSMMTQRMHFLKYSYDYVYIHTITHIIGIPSYSYFIPWNAMKFHDLPSKDHWHEAGCGAERQQWPWPKKGHGHGNEDFSMENHEISVGFFFRGVMIVMDDVFLDQYQSGWYEYP